MLSKTGSVPKKPIRAPLDAGQGRNKLRAPGKKVGRKNPDTQRLARTRVVQLRSWMKAFVQSRRKGRETPREHAEGESPELNDCGVGTGGPWSRIKPN